MYIMYVEELDLNKTQNYKKGHTLSSNGQRHNIDNIISSAS